MTCKTKQLQNTGFVCVCVLFSLYCINHVNRPELKRTDVGEGEGGEGRRRKNRFLRQEWMDDLQFYVLFNSISVI